VLRAPPGAVTGNDQLGRELGERGSGRLDDRLERGAAQVEAADDGKQPLSGGSWEEKARPIAP
jgi:hypothetical protein